MTAINILKGLYTPPSGPTQLVEAKKLNKINGRRGITIEVDYLARQCLEHTDEGSPFTLKLSARRVEILVEGKTVSQLTRKGRGGEWIRSGKPDALLNQAAITRHVRTALQKMSGRGNDEMSVSGEEADIEAEHELRDRSGQPIINNYLSCPHCDHSNPLTHVDDLTHEVADLRSEVRALSREISTIGKSKSETGHKTVIVLEKSAERVADAVDNRLSEIQHAQAKQNRDIEELRGRVEGQADLEEVLQQVIAEKEDLQRKNEELTRARQTKEDELNHTNIALLAQCNALTEKLSQLEYERQSLLARQEELNDTVRTAEEAAAIAAKKITAQNASQTAALDQKQKKIVSLESTLDHTESLFKQADRAAEQRGADLERANRELRTLELNYTALEREQAEAEKAIARRDRSIAALQTDLDELRATAMAHAEEHIAELQQIQQEKERAEIRLRGVAQALAVERMQLQQDNAQQTHKISELTNLVAENDYKMAVLQQEFLKTAAELDGLYVQLAEEELADNINQDLFAADNAKLIAQIDTLKQEKAAIENQLREVMAPAPIVTSALIDRPPIVDLPQPPSNASDISLADIAKARLASALDDLEPLHIPSPMLPSASRSASLAPLIEQLKINSQQLHQSVMQMHSVLRNAHTASLTATLSPLVSDEVSPEELAVTAQQFGPAFTHMHTTLKHLEQELRIAQLEQEKHNLIQKAARSRAIAHVAAKKLKEARSTQTQPQAQKPTQPQDRLVRGLNRAQTLLSHTAKPQNSYDNLFQIATKERASYNKLTDEWTDEQLRRDIRRISDIHNLEACKTELIKETALRKMNAFQAGKLMLEALNLQVQLKSKK